MVQVIRQKSLSKRFKEIFSGFKLFALFGVMTLVVGLTFYLTTKQQDIRQRASGTSATEYGFNTHINATQGTGYWENLTPVYFKKTVDDLIVNHQQWIRVSITPWELITAGTPQSITWNEPVLQLYVDALSYAKSHGLKVFIATALPDFADQYTPQQYLDSNVRYHTKLANSFKDLVDVWQIYNEADIRTFKGYKPMTLSDLNSTYLDEFVANFRAVKNAIKTVNPNIKFTANASGYPVSAQETTDRMYRFFDAVAPDFDIVSLDLYPLNTSDISILKSMVIGFESRYTKPVIIAETGFPTGDGRYTENDQATLLTSTIEQLKAATPVAILIYQYSDTLPTTDPTESSFGVVKIDGTQKSSYSQIMQALQPLPAPTAQITPTAIPTPTPTPVTPTNTPTLTPTAAPSQTPMPFLKCLCLLNGK